MTLKEATPLGVWVPIPELEKTTGLSRDQILDDVFLFHFYDFSGFTNRVRRIEITKCSPHMVTISKSYHP